MADARTRSLTKSITYRVTNIVADLVVVYALTRRLDITIGVTVVTNMASTVIYYGHERIWNKINWGRKKK